MTNYGQSNGSSQQENISFSLLEGGSEATVQIEKELKGSVVFQIDDIDLGATVTASASLDKSSFYDVYVKKINSATPETLLIGATTTGLYEVVGIFLYVKLTISGAGLEAEGKISSIYN